MAIPFKEALQRLENRRVKSTRPLIPPQILQEDLPLCVFFATLSPADADAVRRSLGAAQTVLEGRKATEEILRGMDDRLIVIVGYVILVSYIALRTQNFTSAPAPFMMSTPRLSTHKN